MGIQSVGNLTKTISSINSGLGEMLGELRSFLGSEISVSEPFLTPSKLDLYQGTKFVQVNVKVRNTAPPRDGSGEVVFTGVGLNIICCDNEKIFRRLESALGVLPPTIHLKKRLNDRAIILDVTTRLEDVQKEFDRIKTTKIEGSTLFPGESTGFFIDLPVESLPLVSIEVTGVISPGNLFRVGNVFGLDEETKELKSPN